MLLTEVVHCSNCVNTVHCIIFSEYCLVNNHLAVITTQWITIRGPEERCCLPSTRLLFGRSLNVCPGHMPYGVWPYTRPILWPFSLIQQAEHQNWIPISRFLTFHRPAIITWVIAFSLSLSGNARLASSTGRSGLENRFRHSKADISKQILSQTA